MDKDRVKGTINDVVGNVKRHIGNLTGDTRTEAEGAVQQVKGKVQNTWGKAKDAARDIYGNVTTSPRSNAEVERENREAAIAEDRNFI